MTKYALLTAKIASLFGLLIHVGCNPNNMKLREDLGAQLKSGKLSEIQNKMNLSENSQKMNANISNKPCPSNLELPEIPNRLEISIDSNLKSDSQNNPKTGALDLGGAQEKARNELDQDAKAAEEKGFETPQDPKEKQSWEKLIAYIAEHGKKEDSAMGFYVFLEHYSEKDQDTPHLANHISLIGGFNEKKEFQISRMEVVSANVRITKEGYKDLDQWMFVTSKTGVMARFMHYRLVKKLDGTVISHEPQGSNEEQAKSKWNQIRQEWYQRISNDLK